MQATFTVLHLHRLLSFASAVCDVMHMCCRRMHDEMRAAADSPRLSALTAKTVGKALQLMAEKAEYMTFAGKEVFTKFDCSCCCVVPCLKDVKFEAHG